jgi:hypothetical protein
MTLKVFTVKKIIFKVALSALNFISSMPVVVDLLAKHPIN